MGIQLQVSAFCALYQQVQPILADTVILALASQRASTNRFQLSAAWRLLGWDTPPQKTVIVEAAPRIFVDKRRLGH